MSKHTDLSKRGSKLSPAKRTLLESWGRGESRDAAEAQIIPRRSGKGPIPLSFAQERMWFLDQLEPGNPAYNIPVAHRIEGLLNLAALEQSLGEIVRRHEALRTTFASVDGQPLQIIAPDLNLTLPVVDLRELPETEREAETQRLATENAQRPFDLAQGPLLRVKLVRLSEEEHVFLLTMHHIVSDGWSLGVFMRELAATYETFSTGETSSLPELPIQYADFAVWQRQWLQGEALDSLLAYWKQQLGGSLPLLELPTDRPRPPVQTYRGARHSLELPKNLTDALKALSEREGVTLFTTLLAAFKTLLYRYTGQEDIVVGSPIANRNRAEIEGLIGSFANTLVMRTDLSENPSFLELVGRVREMASGAYTHQDLPLHKLIEVLQPERESSHNPLFQVMFALHNTPVPALELSCVTVNSMEVHSGTAQLDLALNLSETGENLSGQFEYSTDLFDSATIARMANHFRTLLESVVADPEQHLSELLLLTEAERRELLVEWNDTQTEYPLDKCVHQLFEEQVERTPDAIAVVFENQQLTYSELNTRANQLAHYLGKYGVGPEVLVGICMERSLEMAVGVLGILKAGGGYVPLDPAYPKERLAFVLEDTRVPILLTQERLRASLPAHQAQLVCQDAQWDAIGLEPNNNPNSEVQVDNVLYVIYTSGSTGRPKGIALSHRALSNLIQWHLDTLIKGVGVLQFASLSFDASFHEMFATWCSGGTLFMVPESLRLDLEGLVHFVAEKPIQKVILPVVVLQQWAEAYGQREHLFKNLKEVTTTGEQLLITRPIIDLFKRLEDCSLHNHYGPSETHVVTAFTLTDTPEAWPAYPPIGRPIANTQIYLLDANLNPVPVGVPAEVYIGGVSLARGYLGRPDLTAEKFIPDPFSTVPGARLYKTGDLASYLPDGNIKFLGRLDHQVKIRGHRIELGEIETVLGQHPAIQETVVTAREDIPGDKYLAAYVVANEEQAPTINELRRFVKEKLPDYMIPSAFVLLDALPLTPSKKVDRRALPAPGTARPELEEAFVAPRDELELELTRIWEQVLGIQPIGVRDNFFELGGHSLLLARLFAQIQETFHEKVSLATFFQSPTVKQLASILREEETLEAKIQPARSKPIRDTLWVGLKNRLLQVTALYIPGATTARVWLHRWRGVRIGSNVFIGTAAFIEGAYPRLVSIGDNVDIGVRSIIIAHFGGTSGRASYANEPTVRIEDNVHIGPNVTILPNVTIGQGAVITAGSVVKKSIPPLTMVQGNPAEPIAHCGIPLAGNSYSEFVQNLEPIRD